MPLRPRKTPPRNNLQTLWDLRTTTTAVLEPPVVEHPLASFRSPARGGMIVAQGNAAEAAARGCAHLIPSLPLFLLCRAGPAGAAKQEKGERFILRPQPRRSEERRVGKKSRSQR